MRNGSLNDEDVGQGTFVNFQANIGVAQKESCETKWITGVNAKGDHLLLTPGWDADRHLSYSARYTATSDVELAVCNPFGITLDGGTPHFNLLVIDAQ